MAKLLYYLDGFTGLGEFEGDSWAYGSRFEIPAGSDDTHPPRSHFFKNQGRFFSDAMGGDYQNWFGQYSYIVSKNVSGVNFPWFQAGCWMKVKAPTNLSFPLVPGRINVSGSAWWATSGYPFFQTDGDFYMGSGGPWANFPWVVDKWYWFEYRVYTHTTSGIGEFRVNGSSLYRRTGYSTASTGGTSPPSGEIDMNCAKCYILDWYSSTADPYYDDMYVMFADTEEELGWVGKGVCEPLYPVGDGDEISAEPLGPTNYMSVKFPIEDGLYVSATPGERDCYKFSKLESDRTRTIHGVRVTARARKSAAPFVSMRCYCRISGTNYYGDTYVVGPQWREYVYIWDENPHTSSAWTKEDVDSAQFGFERVS